MSTEIREFPLGPEGKVTFNLEAGYKTATFLSSSHHIFLAIREANHISYKTDAEKGAGCWVWDKAEQKGKQIVGQNWRNPGFEQGAQHPVTCVSWNDAKKYIDWLNKRLNLPEGTYRLPSESEWEFALRAGGQGEFPWADQSQCEVTNAADSSLRDSGILKSWQYADCNDGYVYTAPVASLKPNIWGLYDMSGNVWEWVEDCWYENFENAPTDGSAWLEINGGNCSKRSIRGGSWFFKPAFLRSAFRFLNWADGANDSAGFRLARTL